MRVTKPGGRVLADVPDKHSHLKSHYVGEEIGRRLPFYYGAGSGEILRMFEEAGMVNVFGEFQGIDACQRGTIVRDENHLSSPCS